jgi:hypothetical protein
MGLNPLTDRHTDAGSRTAMEVFLADVQRALATDRHRARIGVVDGGGGIATVTVQVIDPQDRESRDLLSYLEALSSRGSWLELCLCQPKNPEWPFPFRFE